MSKFDGVLFFSNTSFTQIIHFYTYKLRNTIEDNRIWPMFTKSNTS
jgi:hypothetical protein